MKSIRQSVEDAQNYRKKHYPKLWIELHLLVALITIIITYLIVTYMAAFDHRHYENMHLLIIFYLSDLFYIGDTVYRLVMIRRTKERQAPKIDSKGRKVKLLQRIPIGSIGIVSDGVLTERTWKMKCQYFWSKEFWKKYYTIFLDVLSILPLELLILCISLNYEYNNYYYLSTFSFLKLNRLIRLYKINEYYRKKTHELKLNLTRREVLAIAICFSSFLVILFHGIACIWYSLSCEGVYDSSQNITCHQLGERTAHSNITESSNDTDTFREHPFSRHLSRESDAWERFIAGIHWSVTSIRNSGNRNRPPATATQLVIAMFIQVFGFLMCTAITLIAIYIASQIDLRRAIFFHEAYGAKAFVRHFKLGRTINKFLTSSFNFMWTKDRGFTDHNIKPVLCKPIRTKISMCIFKPMIDASELLKYFSRDELERLSLDIQYKHYFANEFIIRPNTIGHNVFYILNGYVEVMSDEDQTFPIFTLASGSLIGEVNLLFPTRRTNGVKTRAPSDILSLSYSSIMKVGKLEPQRFEQMMNILKTRITWVVEENEKKFQEELQLLTEQYHDEEQHRNSVASAGRTSSAMDPMNILLRRRSRTINERKNSMDQTWTSSFRRSVGTQFMSVLAWLNFYKGEKRVKSKIKSLKYVDIYAKMQKQFRSEPSLKMYHVMPTLVSIPNYLLYQLTVSKESLGYKLWEVLVVAIIAVFSVLYPIELLIANPDFSRNINAVVEVIYIFDLALRLFVFRDPDEIGPIRRSLLSHIQCEFHSTRAWFDLFAILPIHHFAGIRSTSYRKYLYSMMHMYFFKSVKLIRYIKSWEYNVSANVMVVRILKHFLFMGVYAVWLGSTFTYLGCPKYPNCTRVNPLDNNTSTWVDSFFDLPETKGHYPRYDMEHFVYALPLSIFWAICAIFGIQFDIASPSTSEEIGLQTIGLLGGFAIMTYFWSDLAATLAGTIETELHHMDRMVWLQSYMDDQLVDLRLIDRIIHYMRTQWKTLRGLTSDSARTFGFLSVSHTMYTELEVHIVSECLFRTYFFQNMDVDLLRKFSLAATLAVIPPNEEIIRAKDIISRMYIIRRGYVQVYYANTSIKMDVLTSGQSFGEVNMFHGTQSKVTIRSVTYVEVVILDARAIDKILSLSKLHEDELTRFRADKEALEKFDSSIDSVVDGMSAEDIKALKYRDTYFESLQLSRVRDFTQEFDYYYDSTRDYHVKYKKLKLGKYLKNLLLPITYLPDGKFLNSWEYIRVWTIGLLIFLVPIVEAYPKFKENYQALVYLLDLFTFCDMYVRAHIAFYDPRTSKVITDTRSTCKHYLASGFLADFLGSVIVYIIIDRSFHGSEWDTSLLAYTMRLNRLILAYRIFGYYKYKNEQSVVSKPFTRIWRLVMIFFCHAHIVGCLVSVLACPTSMDELLKQNSRCYNNSWVTMSKHFESPSPTWSELYIYSIYYVATTSIGCGFGDFKPSNEKERYFATFLFIFYIFAVTYILARVAGRKSHIEYKLLRFQQQMKYLVGFIGQEKLETKLSRRIIRHYNYQWLKTKGIEPQKLFSNLFPALRKEVAMDVFEDIFNEIPEFKNVPSGFIRAICVYMVPIYFLRRDIIVKKNDICDMIYVMYRGKVAERAPGERESFISTGGVIGIVDHQLRSPVYNRTAICVTNVDLFGIPRKDFIRALKAYPEVAERFEARNLREARELEIVYQRMLAYHENYQQLVTKRKHLSRAEVRSKDGEPLQDLTNQRDSISDLRYVYSEYTVALVMEEGKEKPNVKYDEDTLYAQAILPESIFVTILNWLSILSAALSASLVFYQWSFANYDYAIFGIGYLCDVFFVIKMGMSFRVSYFNEQGEVVIDSTEISNKYLSDASGFALDFLSTFPCEVFTGLIAATSYGQRNNFENTFYYWASFRLNRLTRLVHVFRYYKRRTGGILVHLVPVKLERMLIVTIMYLHFVACILFGFTGFEEFKNKCDCEVSESNPNPVCTFKPELVESGFQTKDAGYNGENPGTGLFCHKYTLSMYFVLTTFTTTAYGDIFPVTPFEMIMISLLALSSKLWLGHVLSDIISALQNNTDLIYHLAAEGVLNLYKDYGVSENVIEKTIQYFTYAWGQNKGVLIPEFFSKAPSSLKMDIYYSIYGEHFRRSYLFRDLPESFIRQACIRVKPEWVIAGDFVIEQGDIDDKLYFVHNGIICFSKDETGDDFSKLNSLDRRNRQARASHCFISRSKYFGEAQGIIGSQHHRCSYRAETDVVVVSLSHQDFEDLFDLFPECREPVLHKFYGKHHDADSEPEDSPPEIISKQQVSVVYGASNDTFARNSEVMSPLYK